MFQPPRDLWRHLDEGEVALVAHGQDPRAELLVRVHVAAALDLDVQRVRDDVRGREDSLAPVVPVRRFKLASPRTISL